MIGDARNVERRQLHAVAWAGLVISKESLKE
jgi:hypothetical protein